MAISGRPILDDFDDPVQALTDGIGQGSVVCRGTVEERIDELIAAKRKLSDEVLAVGAEAALTEMSTEELIAMVSLDMQNAIEVV